MASLFEIDNNNKPLKLLKTKTNSLVLFLCGGISHRFIIRSSPSHIQKKSPSITKKAQREEAECLRERERERDTKGHLDPCIEAYGVVVFVNNPIIKKGEFFSLICCRIG